MVSGGLSKAAERPGPPVRPEVTLVFIQTAKLQKKQRHLTCCNGERLMGVAPVTVASQDCVCVSVRVSGVCLFAVA